MQYTIHTIQFSYKILPISTLWYPTKRIVERVTQFFPALRYRQHLSDFLLQFDVTWHVWYIYLIYKKVSRNTWMKIKFNKSISRNFCLSIHDRKYNSITNLYILLSFKSAIEKNKKFNYSNFPIYHQPKNANLLKMQF